MNREWKLRFVKLAVFLGVTFTWIGQCLPQ